MKFARLILSPLPSRHAAGDGAGYRVFRGRTQKLCTFWGFFAVEPQNLAPSGGFCSGTPNLALSFLRSANTVAGNPATPGRSGGLVYPKTIRLPEVCSTLIPVYSTVPPEHPTARSLLKDFACPRALIKFAEFWPHAFLPMPMPCPCHAHVMQS